MTRRVRLPALGVALLALSLGAAACGSDSDEESSVSETELNQAVRDAEREARREAETQARLDALKEKVNDLEDDTDSTSPPPSESGAEPASSDTTALAAGYETYVHESAGWTAEVPVGGGWSDGVETQVNSGLLRTTFDGPGDSMMTIDATPYEAPAFGGAPIDSRTTVSHPIFGSVEKIVFQGNSNFEMCDRGLCVDFLIDDGSGGFAVLAGGPINFAQTEAVAARVMESLRPYDY